MGIKLSCTQSSHALSEEEDGRTANSDYFVLIPVELSEKILSYFDYGTLCRVACVNRVFNTLAYDDRIWKKLYETDFSDMKWRTFFGYKKQPIWRIIYRDTKWIERRTKKNTNVQPECFKLVVTGDNLAGQKTHLLLSFYHNACPDQYYKGYIPTVFDNKIVHIKAVGNKDVYSVELGLWDTSGHEEFEHLRPLSYCNTNVFLLMFSVVDPVSFENVSKRWFQEIKHCCPNVPILLVGVQRHLRTDPATIQALKKKHQNPISVEQALGLARKLGIPYYEVCVGCGEGVNSLFRSAIKVCFVVSRDAKFQLGFKQVRHKLESPFFISIETHDNSFEGKTEHPHHNHEPVQDHSQWECCYLDENDQYWYNRVTKESTSDHGQEDSVTVQHIISEPFNVKHTESMTNLLELKTKFTTPYNYLSVNENDDHFNFHDSKFNTVPNSKHGAKYRRSLTLTASEEDDIEISEPFNFRKTGSDDNLDNPATSPSTDPLSRKAKSKQNATNGVVISRPFNLQHNFGLKQKQQKGVNTL